MSYQIWCAPMWPIKVFLGHQIGQGVFQKWRVPWTPSKTLMMELKGASVVVMVVILLITGNAIADEHCFQQCLNNCDQLPVLCVRLCLGKCPPDPNLPQNPVDLSHYYGKIGCSLHQFHKFSHGTLCLFIYIVLNLTLSLSLSHIKMILFFLDS